MGYTLFTKYTKSDLLVLARYFREKEKTHITQRHFIENC